MNWFLIVFACFYLAEHVLQLWLVYLNQRHLQQHAGDVPVYFRDKISPPQHQNSIRYTRDKHRLEVAGSLFGMPIFWGLLLSGFFDQADKWARSFQRSSLETGLIFLGAMAVLFYLVSLPFSLYGTFVIEERYGFNRLTVRTWMVDLAKGLLLAIVVAGPLLAVVLWYMEHYLHGWWWLTVWLILAAFQLLLTTVFPILIVPLFNKLTPLPDGSLRAQIHRLADKVRFRMSEVFTMDGSKRSTHSNAFFAGLGRFRRIVMFDTLIRSLEEKEVLAVLAHEMGHCVKKHVQKGLLIGLSSSLAGLYLLSLLMDAAWFYEAFGFRQRSAHAALFIFSKASGSFFFFLEPLFSTLSRKHEYEADRFAAEVTASREAMISALVKLTRENLSNLTPHPLYRFFHYTHPTALERIAALEGPRQPGNDSKQRALG
ncbi:MAG: M48 family metallopeptidase [Acidobacteriota bacterium]